MILFKLYSIFWLILALATAKEIVVRIEGGPLVAELLAMETGHHLQGPVTGFENTYVLIPVKNPIFHPNEQKRGTLTRTLYEDQRIEWAEEQNWKQRQKRDLLDPADVPKQRVKRLEQPTTESNKKTRRNKRYAKNEIDQSFNDELWSQQWYLRDTRTRLDLPKLDLNVLPLYRSGISGKGVRITILDDGIEYTHDDLSPNYDPEISYNCNEESKDPMPRYEISKSNSHGTRCAGEVAMVANNNKCGVGIAFNAKIDI